MKAESAAVLEEERVLASRADAARNLPQEERPSITRKQIFRAAQNFHSYSRQRRRRDLCVPAYLSGRGRI